VIAGDRVYVTGRNSGELFVLRLADGHLIQRIRVGDLPNFPSEVVDGGYVYVGTLRGISAFHG
jgi:hypothetical protein